ncbi:MAG TPA: cupin domain-containing protein [Acidimicrobiia bacterium]|nr:cupin domain-containing protein [Acidimicrobiia bacterium]
MVRAPARHRLASERHHVGWSSTVAGVSRREISFEGVRMSVLIGREDGVGLTVVEEKAPPEFAPPPHAHLDVSETFYILEGSYRFVVDNKRQELGAGEIVTVPPGVTH